MNRKATIIARFYDFYITKYQNYKPNRSDQDNFLGIEKYVES